MSNQSVKNVSAEDAKKLIGEKKDLLILDVRTKAEYDAGHIPGAKLIPTNELAARVGELSAYKATPLLVYCLSGGRSPGAVSFLSQNGFAEIYHMNRGISSWGYELER